MQQLNSSNDEFRALFAHSMLHCGRNGTIELIEQLRDKYRIPSFKIMQAMPEKILQTSQQFENPPELSASANSTTQPGQSGIRLNDRPIPTSVRDSDASSDVFMNESIERRAPDPPDRSSDSALTRYFQDLATQHVMGQDEELQCAQALEEAEIEHWVALLSYVPVAGLILECLERDAIEADELNLHYLLHAEGIAEANPHVSKATIEVERRTKAALE